MDWFVKAFIRASLLWFVGGIALGLAMAIHPAWIVYRPAHAHMNLVGFVVMMIFGVGYQILPRFFGHPIHSKAFAAAHVWLANLGLAGLVAGFFIVPSASSTGMMVTAIGGGVWAIGAVGFAYNMWRTFDAAEKRRRLAKTKPEARKLNVND